VVNLKGTLSMAGIGCVAYGSVIFKAKMFSVKDLGWLDLDHWDILVMIVVGWKANVGINK
jgi:hypothetical protein